MHLFFNGSSKYGVSKTRVEIGVAKNGVANMVNKRR